MRFFLKNLKMPVQFCLIQTLLYMYIGVLPTLVLLKFLLLLQRVSLRICFLRWIDRSLVYSFISLCLFEATTITRRPQPRGLLLFWLRSQFSSEVFLKVLEIMSFCGGRWLPATRYQRVCNILWLSGW